jgi:hypothetical protein
VAANVYSNIEATMIVCDVCHDHKKKCFPVKVHVVKLEEKKGRESERIMITITMDLCEDHITTFNSSLGHFIEKIRKSDNTTTEETQIIS